MTERWIALSEALHFVADATDDEGRAKAEIVNMLTWADASARASEYLVCTDGHLPERKRHAPVPAHFWKGAEIDWAAGAATLGKEYRVEDEIISWDTVIEATGIQIRANELQAKWPGNASAGNAAKPGRKAQYDWEGMLIEATRIIYSEGIPETQAEMAEKLATWFGDNSPSISLIKERVSKIWRALKVG